MSSTSIPYTTQNEEQQSSSSTEQQPQPVTDSVDGDVEMMDKGGDGIDKMDEDNSSGNDSPATVFCIRLKQPSSNLLFKMSVPELCRNFRYSFLFIIRFKFGSFYCDYCNF